MVVVTVKKEKKDEYVTLGEPMNHWVDKVIGNKYRHFVSGETWKPAVNVYQSEKCYVVMVDIAGLNGQDIDVRCEECVLTISGVREVPDEQCLGQPVRLMLMEIDHGRFSRSIELPKDINEDEITASYRCGFLKITIPRVDELK